MSRVPDPDPLPDANAPPSQAALRCTECDSEWHSKPAQALVREYGGCLLCGGQVVSASQSATTS